MTDPNLAAPRDAKVREAREELLAVARWLHQKEKRARSRRAKLPRDGQGHEDADKAKRFALIAARVVEEAAERYAAPLPAERGREEGESELVLVEDAIVAACRKHGVTDKELADAGDGADAEEWAEALIAAVARAALSGGTADA